MTDSLPEDRVTSEPHISFPPGRSILTILILIFLFFALFTGLTYQFYASFLFLFYSWIKNMWLSVICLGAFQTLLMVPLRIISLRQSINIQEFEEKVEEFKSGKKQRSFIRNSIRQGNVPLLWYLINFFTQIITYLSIGKLFLTDFYNMPLDPKLLYSFVSYPEYPIQDTFFKIPYLVITKTADFGMDKVLIFWGCAVVYKIVISKLISIYRSKAKSLTSQPPEDMSFRLVKQFVKQTSGSLVLLLFLGWLVIRHFPVGWELRIFTGDVGIPNRSFNTITAICAFFIILWLDLPKIREKSKLAEVQGISKDVIQKTQIKLFEASFQRAAVIGLGAYFITNLIPCAFELSIFTLEIISFLSPFTLDKAVFKMQSKMG